ncbi:MAG: methyltransferase domain-containing protein [Bacteroidota bacterium]
MTLVPWQKQEAEKLNKRAGLENRIQILTEDYTATSISNNSVDHVMAIESGCYAKGADKADLLAEIHRILKPGGSFVIADGFLKSKKRQGLVLRKAYEQLCRSWALTELGNINEVLEKIDQLGFENVNAQNISWKVAPSVAHVPHTVISFLMKQFFFGKDKMTKERWDNLKSPLLTMVLGLHQRHFGYYLVKGQKRFVL